MNDLTLYGLVLNLLLSELFWVLSSKFQGQKEFP